MPVYKIAIAGASSLLGRELKDAISESPLAAATFVLLDEEDAKGQLDQVGDEVTFIQTIGPDAFDRVDFTFLCGTEMLTRKHWRQALRSGSTVLDMSGALDREAGVLVRAPWLGSETATVDLFTPAVVPAHPAAVTLGLLLERVQQAVPVRFAAATVLAPASEFGRGAMDELHQQTVSLLSFQGLPRAIYDAQAAYNLLNGMGESSTVNLVAVEARIRRHYDALSAGRWPALALQVVHAPVFHGLTFSIAVDLERPVEIVALEEALSGEHVDLVLEDTDSPSNLAATGQNDVLVRMRPEQMARNSTQTSRLWLWAASDNLRLNAQNAVECALDLRRLRPQGTVQ
ncbi:MAG TPA: Asd/ArgC dimerization domain-containing protein [Terracidiphilus sp.]|nr:Asd/ArgC dimerization domain-containing protein [Terracidiphilus sp.]